MPNLASSTQPSSKISKSGFAVQFRFGEARGRDQPHVFASVASPKGPKVDKLGKREREREREQRTEVKGANIDTDKSDLPLSPRLVKLKFLALALNVLFQGQNSEFRERLHTLFLFARSGFLVVGGHFLIFKIMFSME